MKKKIKYRSKAEEQFAKYLKQNKIKFEYEPFHLEYTVHQVRKYWPDFDLKSKYMDKFGNSGFIIEFKGRFTSADRKKMLLVQKENPFHDIRLIFMQDNKISKVSKTKYSDWAKKHGFDYHVGISLPKEWIEELR